MKRTINIVLLSVVAIFATTSICGAMDYKIVQITYNSISRNPRLNANGHVVWHGAGGSNWDIFLYDGTGTTQITNNVYADVFPQINDNGRIVWHESDGEGGGIFLYDGTDTIRIPDSNGSDSPQTNADGYVVFQAQRDASDDFEIYLYNSTGTIQITDNTVHDWSPKINADGQIVWSRSDSSDSEIFLYDDISTTQITNNDINDFNPQINHNGQIVWRGFDGSDDEIFLYDGTSTSQITNNSIDDSHPQINDNDYVVWSGRDGSDDDIFLAIPNPITEIVFFFESGIENKTIKVKVPQWLRDTGDRKPVKRYKEKHVELMNGFFETAQRNIEGGFDSAACGALEAAYTRIDGQKIAPADWFKGIDAPSLATMIQDLMTDLNCQ